LGSYIKHFNKLAEEHESDRTARISTTDTQIMTNHLISYAPCVPQNLFTTVVHVLSYNKVFCSWWAMAHSSINIFGMHMISLGKNWMCQEITKKILDLLLTKT